MEIKARYTLIGAFVLAVTAAAFGFVYWLNTAGALGQRQLVKIRYEASVAGLLRGSAVLFNGVRVGEVVAIDLDPSTPRRILVTVAVDRATPLRSDTKAGIEFQGLSGAPVVALAGGATGAEPLKAGDGGVPMLMADADAGQSLTQTAREVMRNVDTVVSRNAEPLHALIANVDKFAEALARNSHRVDGILAGLERLTGGGAKPAQQVLELSSVRAFPGLGRVPAGQLVVVEPTALSTYDTAKVLVRATGADGGDSAQAVWPDVLPKVMHARIVQSFENAGYARVLGRLNEGAQADYQLMIDIRRFQISGVAPGRAEVEYSAKLVGAGGQVLDARVLRAEAPAAALTAEGAGVALDRAFGATVAELVVWACASIGSRESAPNAQPAAPRRPPAP